MESESNQDKRKFLEEIRIKTLRGLGKYKKAVPIVQLDGIKFSESNFIIRFDLITFPAFPDYFLSIGDICKISNNFYSKLMKGVDSLMLNFPDHGDFTVDSYVLTAFVEMNSKNHREIFCVLRKAVDQEIGIIDFAKTKEGNLLLFSLQSLIKIK